MAAAIGGLSLFVKEAMHPSFEVLQMFQVEFLAKEIRREVLVVFNDAERERAERSVNVAQR